MAVWRFEKGENAKYEGTILVATSQGSPQVPYDCTGATLVLHFGPTLGSVHKTWFSGGSSFIIMGGTSGVWQFEWQPEDTESLAVGSYYFDLWLRTTAQKEYCTGVGTIQLNPILGTI